MFNKQFVTTGQKIVPDRPNSASLLVRQLSSAAGLECIHRRPAAKGVHRAKSICNNSSGPVPRFGPPPSTAWGHRCSYNIMCVCMCLSSTRCCVCFSGSIISHDSPASMKMLVGLRSRWTMGGSFSSRAAMPRATPKAMSRRAAKLLLGAALYPATLQSLSASMTSPSSVKPFCFAEFLSSPFALLSFCQALLLC